MNQSMIIWCVMAGVLLSAFILRSVVKLIENRGSRNPRHTHLHLHPHTSTHILEMGEEKDMFFIPGDCEDDDRL